MHMPITTAVQLATGKALVLITPIAIIAFFVALITRVQIGSDHTISATRQGAVEAASVEIIVIAIITGFKARCPLTRIHPEGTISTIGGEATREAGVAVIGVPIVTGFEEWVLGIDILSQNTVSAVGRFTGVRATVIVVRIAIIALLLALPLPISAVANRGVWGRSRISRCSDLRSAASEGHKRKIYDVSSHAKPRFTARA